MFYAPDIAEQAILPEEEAKHCLQVLRHRPGDTIHITDGAGKLYEAVITGSRPKNCTLTINKLIREDSPSAAPVCVAVTPTKNADRLEWLTEKITELGVSELLLLQTKRTERTRVRTDRLERIITSAMKQSLQSHRMKLSAGLVSLKETLERYNHSFNGQRLVASLTKGWEPIPLLQAIKPKQASIILIGPEGDFTPEEEELMKSWHWQPVSLGNTRLRTETAALSAAVQLTAYSSSTTT